MEFRLDDPTVEDHKFTDDDDECAFQVDGWELIWWLGDNYVKDTVDTTDNVILTHFDIYFSRKDRKVAICPFDDSEEKISGVPGSDLSSPATLFGSYPEFTVECVDIDSSCIEYDVECPDLLNEIDVDDYMKDQSVLNWYGWF